LARNSFLKNVNPRQPSKQRVRGGACEHVWHLFPAHAMYRWGPNTTSENVSSVARPFREPRVLRTCQMHNFVNWGGLTVTNASAAFERHHGQTSPAAENGANTTHSTRGTVAADILQSKRSRQKRIYKCIADDGHQFSATRILAKGGAHGMTCSGRPWQRR
jgi:hypothetical protein